MQQDEDVFFTFPCPGTDINLPSYEVFRPHSKPPAVNPCSESEINLPSYEVF